MKIQNIMVCLDGSKHSLKGLEHAISMAKLSDATIIGVHSDTTHGLFTAVHGPRIKEEKWSNEIRGIIATARKKTEKIMFHLKES